MSYSDHDWIVSWHLKAAPRCIHSCNSHHFPVTARHEQKHSAWPSYCETCYRLRQIQPIQSFSQRTITPVYIGISVEHSKQHSRQNSSCKLQNHRKAAHMPARVHIPHSPISRPAERTHNNSSRNPAKSPADCKIDACRDPTRVVVDCRDERNNVVATSQPIDLLRD